MPLRALSSFRERRKENTDIQLNYVFHSFFFFLLYEWFLTACQLVASRAANVCSFFYFIYK